MKNSQSFRVRFNGPRFDEHLININELAPALLSIADMCTDANTIFNDGQAFMEVLVKANVEQNCFEIEIKVVQSIYEQIKLFIGNSEVKNVKEILEWIGIITQGAVTISVLELFRRVGNRKVESTELKDNGLVELKIEGDNEKIVVTQPVAVLVRSKKTFEAMKSLAKAVDKQGCAEILFEHQGEVISGMKREDAALISQASYQDNIEETKEEPQLITGHVCPYEVEFNLKSKKWKFIYNEKVEVMDISRSNIAEIILNERGKVLPSDCFKVTMEVTEKKTEKGFKNHYSIIEVLDFIPGNEQRKLF